MKFLNKLTLIIYSWIMLVVSIILCAIIFRWIEIYQVERFIQLAVTGEMQSKIILGVSAVFILLSIKCIFFSSYSSNPSNEGQGVLLENENGKLMISKETLENLVNSVARGFGGTEEINTRIEVDPQNNVNVYANLVVSTDVVIKDLSSNLQKKIKEKVKNATDLEVKEVNIKVKNVAPKKDIGNI